MTHKQIENLWQQVVNAIDSAAIPGSEEAWALRDYRSNSSHGLLAKLISRESAHERQHRKTRHHGHLSVPDAAKLLTMSAMATGAQQTTMPPATIFLSFRDTAAESYLLGYLLRNTLSADWIREADALDYAAERAA